MKSTGTEEFETEYSKASQAVMDALQGFEQATGRRISAIRLIDIDITHLHSARPRRKRQVEIDVEREPAEVEW